MKNSLVVCTLAALLGIQLVQAQFTLRGGISGIVTDQSQAAVPNAHVILVDVAHNQTFNATTNSEGMYSFPNLTPGRYQVSVEAQGFKRALSPEIDLGTQQAQRVDLALEVGSVDQSVDVKGEAALLQTDQAVVGEVVSRQLVEDLPSLGRNFTSFVNLAPDISTSPRGNVGATFSAGTHQVVGGTNFTVGGGGSNGFYINGTNTNDNYVGGLTYSPSLEAVAEVKVDVANFSAANGRDMATLSIVTRSGTNQYHGSVFDYLQNGVLNAFDPYVEATSAPGTPKPFLQRNQ